MKITRLELATTNLPALQAFYTHQLRLPLVASSPFATTFQVGWSELVFKQVKGPVHPYHFAFNIPLYTLEQCSIWYDLPYLDTGLPGQRIAHFPDWKARASYFVDPSGNIVEFIERYDAGYADGFFQGISEIGVATDDVAGYTARLNEKFGLQTFAKSRPTTDFNAVGDDYGLLILAQTNRPWLFTNVPALASPYQLEFTTQNGQRYCLTDQRVHSRN